MFPEIPAGLPPILRAELGHFAKQLKAAVRGRPCPLIPKFNALRRSFVKAQRRFLDSENDFP
jgi:hypothetical protein